MTEKINMNRKLLLAAGLVIVVALLLVKPPFLLTGHVASMVTDIDQNFNDQAAGAVPAGWTDTSSSSNPYKKGKIVIDSSGTMRIDGSTPSSTSTCGEPADRYGEATRTDHNPRGKQTYEFDFLSAGSLHSYTIISDDKRGYFKLIDCESQGCTLFGEPVDGDSSISTVCQPQNVWLCGNKLLIVNGTNYVILGLGGNWIHIKVSIDWNNGQYDLAITGDKTFTATALKLRMNSPYGESIRFGHITCGNLSIDNFKVSTETACTEDWSCTAWTCANSTYQTRACTDANQCGTITQKPQESRAEASCQPVCQESWSCSPWACANQTHTARICTDSNHCGTTANKPLESQSNASCQLPCLESWSCAEWFCLNSTHMTRNCIDNNSCGTTTSKPIVSQANSSCQGACLENWNCSAWSNCSSSLQTRVCVDINNCNTTMLKPSLQQNCSAERCGDGICQPTENCESCPTDCACQNGTVCKSGSCVAEAMETFDTYAVGSVPAAWEDRSTQFGYVLVRSDYKGFVSTPNALRVYVQKGVDVNMAPGTICTTTPCNAVAWKMLKHDSLRERYSFDARFSGSEPGFFQISHALWGMITVQRMGTEHAWNHVEVFIDWASLKYNLVVSDIGSGAIIANNSNLAISKDTSPGNAFIITQPGYGSTYLDNLKIEDVSGLCGNGACDAGESCGNCVADCGCGTGFSCKGGQCLQDASCGDNVCAAGENCQSCPLDCGCPEGEACLNATCSKAVLCGDGFCDSSEGCALCEKDCPCAARYSCKQNQCVPDSFVLIDEVHSSGVTENPPSDWSTEGSQGCEPYKGFADNTLRFDDKRGSDNTCVLSRTDHLPPAGVKATVTNYFVFKPAYADSIIFELRDGDHSASVKFEGGSTKEIFFMDGETATWTRIPCTFESPYPIDEKDLRLTTDYDLNVYDFSYTQSAVEGVLNARGVCQFEKKGISMKVDRQPAALAIESTDSTDYTTQMSVQVVKATYAVQSCGDGQCSGMENCGTCSADCGCGTEQSCQEGRCVTCEEKKVGQDTCSGADVVEQFQLRNCSIVSRKAKSCRDGCVNDQCVLGCKSDSECPLDQSCKVGRCERLACTCGEPWNHVCPSVECCSDKDCGTGKACSLALHKCVGVDQCQSLIKNGPSSSKADIVFIGDGYASYQALEMDIRYMLDSQNHGFFSVEPFKTSKEKFNIWMINSPTPLPLSPQDITGEMAPNRAATLKLAGELCPFVEYKILLSPESFRAYCYFDGDCYLGLGWRGRSKEEWGGLLLHEFGHGFAQLADEYYFVVPGDDGIPKPPNCAKSQDEARLLWGDLVGKEKVGYFSGCGGNCDERCGNYIRPTQNSIMKDDRVLEDDYYPVNERNITGVLNRYT